ncbi:MAG TPA: DNA polymerase I, partial [Myxococcota bacterium]|nr:DNA polymerase I [Myxococcota bacterium]
MASTPIGGSRLVIVDAHSHALRAYHALAPMSAPDGLPTHAIFGLAGLLHRLVFEDRPDYLAIVFDAPDDSRTTFRSALYPAYKAHRSARPADLTAQMAPLRELARAFGLTPLEDPSYEADDLVAALVRIAEEGGLETTILSADKDLMQLVSERTTLWDSMRGRRYTPATVKEKL